MKKFRIFIIVMLVLSAILFGVYFIVWATYTSNIATPERDNTLCDTDERIFDTADKLTESEETVLRDKISKYEKKLGADIVIVLMNEDIGGNNVSFEPITNYTVNFYQEHNFGWNSNKDGIIMVANYYDGFIWIESWGKLDEKYDDNLRQELCNNTLVDLKENPYDACMTFVKGVSRDMTKLGFIKIYWSEWVNFLIAGIVSIIFLLANTYRKPGKKTTDKSTYLKDGVVNILDKKDILISKKVTHHTINTGSGGSGGGGGGGGGHSGSGGRF